jgi:hypothetical protein
MESLSRMRARWHVRVSHHREALEDLPHGLDTAWRHSAPQEYPGIRTDAFFFRPRGRGPAALLRCGHAQRRIPAPCPPRRRTRSGMPGCGMTRSAWNASAASTSARTIPHVERSRAGGPATAARQRGDGGSGGWAAAAAAAVPWRQLRRRRRLSRHDRRQLGRDLLRQLVDVEAVDEAVVGLHRERQLQAAVRAVAEFAPGQRGNVRRASEAIGCWIEVKSSQGMQVMKTWSLASRGDRARVLCSAPSSCPPPRAPPGRGRRIRARRPTSRTGRNSGRSAG